MSSDVRPATHYLRASVESEGIKSRGGGLILRALEVTGGLVGLTQGQQSFLSRGSGIGRAETCPALVLNRRQWE